MLVTYQNFESVMRIGDCYFIFEDDGRRFLCRSFGLSIQLYPFFFTDGSRYHIEVGVSHDVIQNKVRSVYTREQQVILLRAIEASIRLQDYAHIYTKVTRRAA